MKSLASWIEKGQLVMGAVHLKGVLLMVGSACALALSSCSSMGNRDVGAVSGAVVGGAAGGAIGSQSGDTAAGVAAGVGVGAVSGALIGAAQDAPPVDKKKEDSSEKILELQEKEFQRQDRELQDLKRQEYYDDMLRHYEGQGDLPDNGETGSGSALEDAVEQK